MYNALVIQQQVHLTAALAMPDNGIAHVGCLVHIHKHKPDNCFGADTVRDNDHQSRHSLGGFCPAGHSAGLWPSRALRVHLPFDIRYIRSAPSVPSVPSIHIQTNLS